MLLRHLKFENDSNRESIGEKIGQDVQGGVCEIEDVDLNAFSRSNSGPGHFDGLALKGGD